MRSGFLIILDGCGVNPEKDYNAVFHAATPTLDSLYLEYPHEVLNASESFVGLPKGFMGNSEVGHLNIGAGRVVFQDFSLISRSIEKGAFFENKIFLKLLADLKRQKGGTLHLVGLVSDGGVHSHISHLSALIGLAKRNQVEQVAIHALLDGRDTPPTSGVGYLKKVQSFCEDLKLGTISTVIGRFYGMDRDKRWDRVQAAYDLMVGVGEPNVFDDVAEYVEEQYNAGTTDEFMIPARQKKFKGIKDGDAVIFFNFRADRARELTMAFNQADFPHFRRHNLPTLSGFATFTCYDESFSVPFAYGKPKVPNTLGEFVSQQGGKQLRIAETEKYAHVTYFFSGGDEKEFKGEKRVLIPSPREVRTYDLKPEMSAREVTATLLKELQEENYQLVVLNFANPDMVGHTGNFQAAVKAMETVDSCLGEVIQWVESHDAFAVVTADHGNVEQMMDDRGMPMTSHSMLPVPFIVVDPMQKKEIELKSGGGRLCDIAPTIISLWALQQPKEMTGESLIV